MTATTVDHVVPLWSAIDVGLAGAKAATLAVLAAEGFAVPAGVVVTTRAFAEALAESVTLGEPAQLPADVLAALVEAVRPWGSVAVRSSAVAEDLAGASYAGMYTSVLDVPTEPAALAAAVERCWASARSELVAGYGGPGHVPAMAVLVQPMVAATVAGVAFTADPVTGERDVVVLDAVPGVAARLADGEVTPDRWVVRADRAERAAGVGEAALDADSALAVARMARTVAGRRRAPQDIEWALAGGEPVLLQARPITALPVPPVPVDVEVPPGYWTREASHARRPWTRLTHDLFRVRVPALRAAVAELGLLFEGLDAREIGGLEYTRVVPLGDKEPPNLPAWLVPVAFRVIPTLRRRIRTCVDAMRRDVPMRVLRQWADEWRPDLEARTDALRDADLGALTDDGLDAHLAAAVALGEDGVDIHFRLHAAIAMVLGEFAGCCRELLGWDEAGWQRLVAGTSVRSTEPAHVLAELAAHVDEPDFADRFADHLRRHCCRALSYELAEQSLDERPELVLALLRDQLATGFDPVANDRTLAAEREQAASEARARLSDVDRARFDAALARALVAYPIREDNHFVTTAVPGALVRKAVLEYGRRLVARGQLPVPDMAFHLRPAELRAALRVGDDVSAVASGRAGERAWAMANPGPAHYGTPPPPPPPMTSLPPEARRANESFLWTIEQVFGPDFLAGGPRGDEKVLPGIAASPGAYRGTVRIVHDETEFDRVRAGDVVVCPTTSPVWSLLFPIIGALVTDEGGTLSHPAIIAREHGVPAVVATRVATATLRDGQRVAVDGGAGTVTVLA
ncbi:MAG: hypothetical protein GEV28_40885 [Actinophytocola sp.]|uniref:PEP/pyruvate-binding domain-containing protein n=1 Tax=Actinophytocola sp. TaxID=1872138 RepID=UPI001325716D|nr:PEP/pyruvate-binding domain-containing protein [Actinophytocola sp.]MPZ86392.1 hypothetical protein [Actinophytocola sp.]